MQCRNLAMKGLFIIALVFLMGSSLSSSRPQRYCDLSGAFMAYPVFRDRPEVSGAEKFQGEHFELYIRDLTINRVLLWQIRMMSFIVQDNHMIRMCIPWESTGRMGWMAHRKWKEIKQQPSMLPGPAVSGCCLVSFHFMWAIHPIRPVHTYSLGRQLVPKVL